ncbi:MAG: alpha/beta hydrolase-fold protein [Chitinophagaceae bacterium]
MQPSRAQTLPAGPQVLTFFSDADDTEQPYGLYLPPGYDSRKKYPLVIMLHGAGSNHRLALRRVFGKSNAPGETDVEATCYFPEWKDVDYIVASPLARGTAGYQGIPEKDVYDVLADVKKRFSVDTNRIYLTGLSMGGGGTLWLGLSRPDIWAAIAPVCPAPPRGTELLMPNALHVPVYFFHGDADPVVPVEGTRNWVKNLKESGARVLYDEYKDVQHDSWVPAYADGKIFNWFDTIRRNPYPGTVRFVTSQYRYNKAYWVTMDAFTPGTPAQIEADFTKPNVMRIQTKGLDAFTLHIAKHPQYKKGEALDVTIDGKNLKATPADAVHFVKEKEKWIQAKTQPAALAKQKGAEGPLQAAFADRHVYVYGTRDNPAAGELQKRMQLALHAANWSAYRGEFLGRIQFYPRVMADKEVRPSDLQSSHLILFGTRETNSIIHQYSAQLPMHLDSSAANSHGLFYVYPLNGKYVAVSSGLPWWEGVQQQGFSFVPPAQGSLYTLKDFIFFKASARQIITDGFFNNQWQLPVTNAQAMATTGVVDVKK